VISTNLVANIPKHDMQNVMLAIKLGRVGAAEGVSNVICLLVSSNTSNVIAQVIGVDGGMCR